MQRLWWLAAGDSTRGSFDHLLSLLPSLQLFLSNDVPTKLHG